MIKKLVYQCLDEQPHTRNNDFALYRAVIERGENCLLGESLSWELIEKYPFTCVVRYRADIQNKEGLCQATERVKAKRLAHAETKRKLFGLFPIWS